MSPRRHSADLFGRRHDLGIGARDKAAGLGVGLGRLLSIAKSSRPFPTPA
jgi:hypothetical protein